MGPGSPVRELSKVQRGNFSLGTPLTNVDPRGSWVAQPIKHLPLAWVMIPGGVLGSSPTSGSPLGGASASPSLLACSLSLSLSQINEIFLKRPKNQNPTNVEPRFKAGPANFQASLLALTAMPLTILLSCFLGPYSQPPS